MDHLQTAAEESTSANAQPGPLDAVLPSRPVDALDDHRDVPSPDAPTTSPPPRRSRNADRHAEARVVQVAAREEHGAPTEEPIDELERIYGSREGYRERARTKMNVSPAEEKKEEVIDVEGIRLAVRMAHDVSSTPTQAPLVATVRRRTTLGPYVVAPGSEVHGLVVGGQRDRVFAEFRFIKLKDGTRINLRGVARGARGRMGIRAFKTLTEESGDSMGKSALTGAIRGVSGVMGAAGGAPGRIAGGAIDGTVETAEEKIRETDNDNIIAIAQKGEPFEIYVTSLGS